MPPHSLHTHAVRPSWTCTQTSKIAIIGAGELGLRAAVEFADRGYEVVCAELDGEPPDAASLRAEVHRNARAGRLRLTRSCAEAARHGQVIILAVESPDGEGRRLAEIARVVGRSLSGPAVVVDRTAVSAAVADRNARLLAQASAHEVVVVSQATPADPSVRVFARSAAAAASLLHRFG